MTVVEDATRHMHHLEQSNANLTAIRTLANAIGKNQELAAYLGMHGGTKSRLLALLILDLKVIDTTSLAAMITDIERAEKPDQRQLSDWLVASVIMKKSALKK